MICFLSSMACTSFLSGSTRTECSVLSCAWKAPRVLSGFLASTAPTISLPWESTRTQTWGKASSHRSFTRKLLCREVVHVTSKTFIKSVETAFHFKTGRVKFRARTHIRWRLYCSISKAEYASAVTVETLWEVLKPSISYLSPEELQVVSKALKLAFEAHDGQKRRSGEPFIIHPVEVAHILGELELDCESIIAGLLHDTVEDSNVVTFERIEKEFGPVVRRIVEGETKVSKIGKLQCKTLKNSAQDAKANDLRQMFLAMAEEVRVIIVKLADRLHNMRTLCHMPPHKQFSIASETLEIFAPLSKLLGMYQIKSELETLSLMYTKPDEFAMLNRRVEQLFQEQEQELKEAKKILENKMDQDSFLHFVGMDIEVFSVHKEIYSIYKMLSERKCSMSEVNDIAQLRVILKQKPHVSVPPPCSLRQICYHILGIVHGMWTPVPRAMKDYIATPKPNGYQSLHTKVIPFLNESTFRVEVQIRTEEMDQIAEKGIAVYYSGKGISSLNNADIVRRVSWLNAIREWQDEFVGNMSSREFVDTVTVDLLGGRVFVFTPKGEIKNLPKGATVIDYAYQIHSEIGNKMVAAKVNGNLVSPFYQLANAEVVEIIIYDGLPSKESYRQREKWLQHAKTRSARHKITKFLKEQAALFGAQITCKEMVDDLDDVMLDNLGDVVLDGIGSGLSVLPISLTSRPGNASIENRNFWSAETFKSREGYINIQPVQNKLASCKQQSWNCNGTVPGMIRNLNGELEILNKNRKCSAQYINGVTGARFEMMNAPTMGNGLGLEGMSSHWFHVSCVDRKGIVAEITSLFTAAGIQIHGYMVKQDCTGTLAMLVQIEGNIELVVNTCTQLNTVQGIINWSVGSNWQSEQHQIDEYFEC